MARSAPLRPDQYERYRRHLSLPELGLEGQQRLFAARVLVIGAGGLGCPVSLYLAAAGVGRIGLVDFDVVEASNLQRQVLYTTTDLGRPKVEVAAERLGALNPDLEVVRFQERFGDAEASARLSRSEWDVVVDGSDNFATRYAVNDACVEARIPCATGAILRFEGQITTFDPRRGPCYRCLFPEPPPPELAPSCAEAGVLGVLPGLVGTLQATEVVKLLTGLGEPLVGRFLHYDALAMRFTEFHFERDPACASCGSGAGPGRQVDEGATCVLPAPGEDRRMQEVSAAELAARRERREPLLLLDVREPAEVATARIEGSQVIPLGELPARLAELSEWKDRPVVVHCHHGGRSAKACQILSGAGFTDVANLVGGIDAWSLTVDPEVPRY